VLTPHLAGPVGLAGCLLGSALGAQGLAPAVGQSGFGVQDEQVVNVSAYDFLPNETATDYEIAAGVLSAKDNVNPCGRALFAAPIGAGLIPNGALITGVAAYVADSTSVVDENIRVLVCRRWVDVDGSNPGEGCLYDLATAGSPGDTVLEDGSDVMVRYREDVDSDGTAEVVAYYLLAQFGVEAKAANVCGFDLGLRQVTFYFRRQISPPPALATFSDVPLDHSESQFIEALAAAGISQGCGVGKFCPDNPVTRAQLAMFLARALGLHWPAL
jgi:hypothetical protein